MYNNHFLLKLGLERRSNVAFQESESKDENEMMLVIMKEFFWRKDDYFWLKEIWEEREKGKD